MKTLEEKISYLKEAIQYGVANDIFELPRPEFATQIKRCSDIVPPAAIPYCVLVMMIEEQSSTWYKIKKFLRIV